jgi:L-lactate dehydrogenase (cytochrome)
VKAASALDYRELARRRLPKFLFEYIEGGSYAEVTLKRNVADLEAVPLRQRVLRDVSNLDLSTKLFGQKLAMPIALGPVGLAGLNARRGECQAARAAEAAGIPFCLSTFSLCPIAEVTRAVTRPIWFQLYMLRDRGFMRDLLARALEAGCSTLVFSVDMPVPGSRYRDYRSGLAGAPGIAGSIRRFCQVVARPRWAWDVGVRGSPHQLGNVAPVLGNNTGLEDYFSWLSNNFDPAVSWRDLEFLRAEWKRPLVVKGILDVEDAKAAAEIGADGIVVSNHGGRQLDGVPSTARALPSIVEAVGTKLTVLADGGVRSGLDVVRMLALGASAVLLGRVWAFALAAGGEAGVAHMLQLLEAEMRVAMALTGVTSIGAITRDILVQEESFGRNWRCPVCGN